jgi:hypothetical protein
MRQKPISKEQCETLVRPERPGRSCRPRSNDEHRAERVVRYLLGHAAPQPDAEPLPRSANYDAASAPHVEAASTMADATIGCGA